MITTYFNRIRSHIISNLQKANDKVTIAMAWFTNDELFDALLDCIRRNVSVELVLMDDVINHVDFGVDFNRFIAAGGRFYLYSKDVKMMHDKFCVIDNQITITGSYNWTNYAESRNCENVIITDNLSIASKYVDEFNALVHDAQICSSFEVLSLNDFDPTTFALRYNDVSEEVYSLPKNKGNAVSVMEHRQQECKLIVPKLMQTARQEISETKAAISVIENHQSPVSRYNIGFKAYLNEKNDIGLKLVVPRGTPLPVTFSRDAWSNDDNIKTVECEFYYGESDLLSSCRQFAKLELADLPLMKAGEVKFKTNVTIDTNGYVRVEFVCANTGKGKDATCINKDFVEYRKI